MIKGDSQPIKIDFCIDGVRTKIGDSDELYFTVKYDSEDEDYIFQKTKANMEYNEQEKCYEFMIEPEDTKDVELIEGYRNLYYDLQFSGMFDGKKIVKTLDRGILYLTYEITGK